MRPYLLGRGGIGIQLTCFLKQQKTTEVKELGFGKSDSSDLKVLFVFSGDLGGGFKLFFEMYFVVVYHQLGRCSNWTHVLTETTTYR